jgi:hypothetical protein
LPVRLQPALRNVALPVKTASVVQEVTTASWASDRQVLPVSAPPAQRRLAGLNTAEVQAAWFETMPSTMTSNPSHVSRTALANSAVFAGLNEPPGAASAREVRLNAPMKPTQL